MFDEPVEFETEQAALAFCAGLGYGTIEGAPVEQFPLRSFEEYDQPFIKAIETMEKTNRPYTNVVDLAISEKPCTFTNNSSFTD